MDADSLANLEDDSTSEDGTTKEAKQLTETETYILARLSTDEYADFMFDENGLKVSVRSPQSSSILTRFNRVVPRESLLDLKRQLDWKYQKHPNYVGYTAPSLGMVEVCAEMGGSFGPGGLHHLLRMSKGLSIDCGHTGDYLHIPVLKDGPIRRRIIRENGGYSIEAARIHVTRRDMLVCIELSNSSPLLATMAARAGERTYYSVKLYFDDLDLGADIVDESEDILHAFLYELNARNNVIFSTLRWPLRTETRREKRSGLPFTLPVRFPVISVDPEISKLFGFASQATGNLTMAFLSYYQILEHFLFAMIRRGVVREVRNTLFDRKFNEKSDVSLMRIVDIVEQGLGGIESKHLRTLISGCVRRGQVEEFLSVDSWGAHFTNKGPIQGVRPLNVKDKSVDILDQIAERVYKLRNRIVHAKDEPKYGDSRVLMPESQEADLLGPDVQLIRLLAMEVIHESQVR
ncbi:hypothetical protein [Sphaerisporangium sp. NPDC051011]|uniref:hypothetical protein n=1 Tax=Sphaerisporangium sp. NPDC051011 TaxID=3155792 RepID=UPI0033C96978